MSTTYAITRVQADEASLDNFNTPISQIQTALNQISTQLSGVANKSAVLLYDMPISADVYVGCLVYYNTTTALMEPAQALLAAEPGAQGQSVEAPSARIVGMVLSKTSATATLLCGGVYTSITAANGCMGAGALPGTYFLSPATAGKAVLDPGQSLRQPALEYMGNGKFTLGLFYMAHDSHQHASVQLTGTWVATGGTPSGTTFRYVRENDDSMVALGGIAATTTAVFYNGILQTTAIGQFSIVSDELYTSLAAAPSAGTVVVMNHYPLAYGAPVVRSISAVDSPRLTVTANAGQVQLQIEDYTADAAPGYHNTAITELSGEASTSTYIVSRIIAGQGIDAAQAADGSVTLSSSMFVGTAQSATMMDLNGAVSLSDGVYVYTVFPQGRTSSVRIYMPVASDADAQYNAYVWLQSVTGACTMNVAIRFIPLGTAGSPATIPTSTTDTTMAVTQPSTGQTVYLESASYIATDGPGMLVAQLTPASAPTNDVQVLRLGFKLLSTSAASTGTVTSNTVTEVSNSNYTAGATVNKFDVVYINNGLLYTCAASNTATMDRALGIAKNTAAVGEPVTFITDGELTGVTPALTPGSVVYVSASGSLTQTEPTTAAYTQKLGVALSASSMIVRVAPAVGNL